jgi:hypothetical protein
MNHQPRGLPSRQDVAPNEVLAGLFVAASTIGGVWLTQGSERKRAAEAHAARVVEARQFETIAVGNTLGSSRCDWLSHP